MPFNVFFCPPAFPENGQLDRFISDPFGKWWSCVLTSGDQGCPVVSLVVILVIAGAHCEDQWFSTRDDFGPTLFSKGRVAIVGCNLGGGCYWPLVHRGPRCCYTSHMHSAASNRQNCLAPHLSVEVEKSWTGGCKIGFQFYHFLFILLEYFIQIHAASSWHYQVVQFIKQSLNTRFSDLPVFRKIKILLLHRWPWT